jgi:hypothetical protein
MKYHLRWGTVLLSRSLAHAFFDVKSENVKCAVTGDGKKVCFDASSDQLQFCDFQNWKPGLGRFLYSFRMIPMCHLGARITGNPHHSVFDKPVKLHWWTYGDKLNWDSNTGSFDPGPNVLTNRPCISTVPVMCYKFGSCPADSFHSCLQNLDHGSPPTTPAIKLQTFWAA